MKDITNKVIEVARWLALQSSFLSMGLRSVADVEKLYEAFEGNYADSDDSRDKRIEVLGYDPMDLTSDKLSTGNKPTVSTSDRLLPKTCYFVGEAGIIFSIFPRDFKTPEGRYLVGTNYDGNHGLIYIQGNDVNSIAPADANGQSLIMDTFQLWTSLPELAVEIDSDKSKLDADFFAELDKMKHAMYVSIVGKEMADSICNFERE